MVEAFIALGSNLGDRHANVDQAVLAMDTVAGIQVQSVSTLTNTAPMGPVQDQPDFINAVARVETTLAPLELLDKLQTIERKMGRERSERWGPRLIDLDILLYGDQTLDHSRLKIPHPELNHRPFWHAGLNELGKNL